MFLLEVDLRGSTEISIGVIAMPECLRVNGVMVFVIGRPIIEKAPYASTLNPRMSAILPGNDLRFIVPLHHVGLQLRPIHQIVQRYKY